MDVSVVTEPYGRVVILVHSMKDVDGLWIQERGGGGRSGGGEGGVEGEEGGVEGVKEGGWRGERRGKVVGGEKGRGKVVGGEKGRRKIGRVQMGKEAEKGECKGKEGKERNSMQDWWVSTYKCIFMKKYVACSVTHAVQRATPSKDRITTTHYQCQQLCRGCTLVIDTCSEFSHTTFSSFQHCITASLINPPAQNKPFQ